MNFPISHVAVERIRAAMLPEPISEAVNIVFASDRQYLPYTAVTLASILKNYRGSKELHVYLLLDAPLPDEDLAQFNSLSAIHPYVLHQIAVDAAKFENIRTSDGISIATYYRLMMHELLPADVSKVLYLDSDLIIRGSIDELFDTEFEGTIFAGVEDTISKTYNVRFGIPAHGRHINAGVLLVNVDAMRAIGFNELVDLYLEANRYRLTLGDQQILAELFFDSIKYVPVKWNVHGSMFNDKWVAETAGIQNSMSASEAKAAIADPAIIHYTLRRKPWISLDHPRSEVWFDYLALTSYAADIPKPSKATKKTAKPAPKSPVAKKQAPGTLSHFFTKVVPATFYSFVKIRKTRLAVAALEKKISTMGLVLGAPAAPDQKNTPKHRLGVGLKSILSARAANAPATFNARDVVNSLRPNSIIMSNVNKKDMDGGYAENIKSILRTSRIEPTVSELPDAVFLLSQRIEQLMFWECVETAYLYDLPLFFTEVALFGAFASYFDPDATLNERRALGFMFDDLGYYFDARQPSRMERTLNDPAFKLTEEQKHRSSALISRICAEQITKYNKYISSEPFEIEPGAVLVIDQKKGDASIEFAGATDDSFARMLEAAVAENPGKPVYFKRHPDSIQRNMNSYRNRNIDEIKVLPDHITIGSIIDRCDKIYTVSSQVGFEGLMRNKTVVTFGIPFYAGWGLTDDRCPIVRRTAQRTIEDIFHVSCIDHSIYIDPTTGRLIEIEDNIDQILQMRIESAGRKAPSV